MIRSKIASPAKAGVKKMTFLWALLALALHVIPGAVSPAHAQGSRKDDIVFNSRGIPLAGATVRVCAMPATGQPCTPLALIYSDAALTQALANPTTTDGLGNYFFYAAPGKYEIEISGPGITTKQIPNVILPNDPASPSFTGGITAFSLNLSGNLTVNGSTTVIGNLASGTLNLSNQSTPPGAASAGTVNLYSKTTDKRLYYKDDTGTETGPLLPGAATNIVNTFTANQNFDSDLHFTGANPWHDLARYGGYFNNAPPSTTASCTSNSTSVTLASALDFQDASKFPGANVGNGIVIYQCGAATGLTTPPAPTVTPFGVINGTTTYSYKYVAEDLQGGLTAASPAGTTSVGAAALGTASVTLTQGVWSNTLNGEITYTCSTNCNVSVNAPINISGFTGNGRFNGNFTIISTPSNTTFVVYSPSTTTPPVTTDTSGGTLKVLACNLLSMPSVSVPNTVEGSSSDTVMRWWVYRNNVLAFVVQQRDPYYEDCGVNIASANIPSYVPSAPSASPVNKYLATTIVSGGGTTSIVVANAAGNTASSQTALHDNSQNLLAAATASRFGTPVYIPSGPNPPFNAATVFTGANAGDAHIRLAALVINQPWVVRSSGMVFEGLRNNGTSFAFGQMAVLTGGGSAFPVVLQLPLNNGTVSAGNQQTLTGVNYLNLEFNAPALQQIAFVNDQSFMFGLLMNNVAFVSSTSTSNVNIPAAVIKGPTHSAIGSPGNENSCAVTEVTLGPPCIRFTTQSPASVNSVVGILAQTEIDGWNMQGGTSFQFDALPWLNGGGSSSSVTGAFNIRMIKMLGEQRFGPFLRVAGASPTFVLKQVDDDAPNASIGNGFIDTAFTSNGPASVIAEDIASSVPVQVLVSGPGLVYSRNSSFAPGTTLSSAPPFGGVTTYSGGSFAVSGFGTGIQSFGSSAIGYGMPLPNTPSLNVGAHGSCSTNCVPSGTWFWEIIANDIYSHNTFPSLSATATVDGTQSVTVSWVPIPGQVSTMRGRGTSLSTVLFADAFGTGVAGNSYVDGNLSYTVSPPNSANANSASLGPSGVTGNQFNYVNGGFIDTISGALTTNRAQTIPDVTGYIPVTSYVNSAYDSATRANGAIGTNWTVTNNGINIASNNFVGTAGTNDVAYWSASPFSNVQFSQVTLTALNGTTDFPGVAVLLSGSGSSTHGYNCVEDTTNIFIQKINGTSNTTLASASTTGVAGDLLRLEVDPAGNLTCYKNSVSTLTVNDTTYTSGSPGLFLFGTVSTAKNWSGGNLHPLSHLDTEQDWTRTQHFTQGIALGGASAESFNNNPRAEQNVFLPGALTSAWTGATWTTDKPVIITRVQVQAKTAPSGCTTNAVVRLTDGTTPVNVTISAAANDSGAISQNYSAGSSLTVAVQTAAAGCATSPADANVTVQYRMQ